MFLNIPVNNLLVNLTSLPTDIADTYSHRENHFHHSNHILKDNNQYCRIIWNPMENLSGVCKLLTTTVTVSEY